MYKQVYKISTEKNYLSHLRLYMRYCYLYGYNPWIFPFRPQIVQWYIVYHVRSRSISVLDGDIAAFVWLHRLLNVPFHSWRKHELVEFTIYSLKKIYKATPDVRLPFLLSHQRLFARLFKVNIANAYHCPFNDLVIVLIVQLYGFLGNRISEILGSNDKCSNQGIKVADFQLIKEPKDDMQVPHPEWHHWAITLRDYKNKK